MEASVLGDLARGASSLEFTCQSAWNQSQCSNAQIGVMVRETCVYSCPEETFDFECVLVEKDEVSSSFVNAPELGLIPGNAAVKYLLVYGNEYGTKSEFSHNPRVNEVTHLELCGAIANKVLLLQRTYANCCLNCAYY